MAQGPQRSKRARALGGKPVHGITAPQRGLFDTCLARRVTVAYLGTCPLCGAGAEAHELEPRPVPDDAGFGEWMLNLPRGQA